MLSSPTNSTIADRSGSVTIGAHGATAVAAPGDLVRAGRGRRRGRRLRRRSRHPVRPRTEHGDVPLRRSPNGTATNGPDYQYTSNDLIFAPGETTKTIRIELENDAANTAERSFTIGVTSSDATVARASATITINGDPNLAVAASSVAASPPVALSNGTMPSTITVR